LFRDRDEGRKKAEVAAERARELNPEVKIVRAGRRLISGAGLGVFRWPTWSSAASTTARRACS